MFEPHCQVMPRTDFHKLNRLKLILTLEMFTEKIPESLSFKTRYETVFLLRREDVDGTTIWDISKLESRRIQGRKVSR